MSDATPIYYVFLKATGQFQGSGVSFFDDDVYGCTETSTGDLTDDEDMDGVTFWWNGASWAKHA
jgi:hypothetical protein